MRKEMRNFFTIIFFALASTGCITPFEPAGVASGESIVVIEGNIIQNDTSRVVVSRTVDLNEQNSIAYVSNAQVWVESESGEKYNGIGVKEGNKTEYRINTVGIDPSKRYKLCVVADFSLYESDYVPVLNTPEIDSIGYYVHPDNRNVTFYVNTHDPQNSTRFYKWNYHEDWEFHSMYRSVWEYDPVKDSVRNIPWEQNRYNCWQKAVSSSILVESTENLSQDVVHQKKLTTIGENDKRVNYLYSIELTQMAISKEAYIYWENMRKNSDNIGGLFSPQPSEITGNIHNTNNLQQRVIGYVSAARVSKKRVYANAVDIGIYKWPTTCETIIIDNINNIPFKTLHEMDYDIINHDDAIIWASRRCVDCRLFGTKNKPLFWPSANI